MTTKITQAEGRRLKREVRRLTEKVDAMQNSWGADYPGIHIVSIAMNEATSARLETAKQLGHVMVIRQSHGQTFSVYAVEKQA